MNKAILLEGLGKILKSWWTMVAGVSLGIAFATFALQHLPKTYQADTTVLVIPPRSRRRSCAQLSPMICR